MLFVSSLLTVPIPLATQNRSPNPSAVLWQQPLNAEFLQKICKLAIGSMPTRSGAGACSCWRLFLQCRLQFRRNPTAKPLTAYVNQHLPTVQRLKSRPRIHFVTCCFIVEPVEGVEPTTHSLQNCCSAIEPYRRGNDITPNGPAFSRASRAFPEKSGPLPSSSGA